ncbi:iron-containing alcohol dehydrogenase [Yersinia ruckeri]|jgi:alcohol dehydrogenase|uniref:iron-containing alcohol dehydrogenase n=1 Tax=Yersinia ruckeri TaxID=29486 RepID=UPI000F8C7CDB|nr:iron-containing alcohol dehydrogenase [Yersinia ruckeri]MCK8540542.1 iron-containing alcohol dehydrogenase [Yersinia ruckeri]MCK8573025.1 iron-containing alcohol dehydrogenase [Yersinia ruckeri]MCK8576042.1 iron-containing alcohol dehydrogenase [Yersinia ruckeri]MCK8578884.1 iron-containing alcohol dehydrogenase [Yersinia ruckeri]MCK8583157.1 iron-containing alcohol dehydrogenase [Yersinia ruckeri]
MSTTFYMPPMSLMGQHAIKLLGTELQARNFNKALIVTDKALVDIKLVDKLTDELSAHDIAFAIFDGVKPNPTEKNIVQGLALLEAQKCDFVISFGGGSSHDCAKGIALVAANGGHIRDYSKGVHLSAKPQLPLVTVNTTAGTAAEMTIFAIVTNEEDETKYPIVDKNLTPIIAVNDSELMVAMPKFLTAATGMDALTHAVEAYVSTAATPITDASAIKAIELIAQNLKAAVDNGEDREAREAMQYGEYLAGMAFSNASLGYVHSMAHQLGGVYDLVHGLCNAILLPVVSRFNAAEKVERFAEVAKAMGVDTVGMTLVDAAEAGILAIEKLSASVGTDQKLSDLGVKEGKLEFMAINALNDACSLTNPRKATTEDIINIFKKAM